MKRVFIIFIIVLSYSSRLEAQKDEGNSKKINFEGRSVSFDVVSVTFSIPINFIPQEPIYESETNTGEIFGNWIKTKAITSVAFRLKQI